IINGVQIGAVGTIPEYRNKGLSRELLKYVKEFYKENTEIFFLYANDRVYDFYEKFDFKHVYEKKFFADISELNCAGGFRKLNIENANDYKILLEVLKNSKPVTKIFGAENYWFLTMWHVFNTYMNDLYYFDGLETVAVQRQVADTLHVYEVFTSNQINLADFVLRGSAEKVRVYFPPDQIFYKVSKSEKEDTGLFLLGDFKLDNHEFRFPITAYT
ncbi:MAG: GNAT family N-acetyltransferase, partial [Melioribacteraceae bacterium]|nr:GNAT family N-acetyltransferase [Melioribacteraceae bacterium]